MKVTKLKLHNVTLLGIDCVSIERLACAMDVSQENIDFGAVKLLTSLPTEDSRKVTIPHIGSIEEFSRFCIEDLYKYVDTDYVLLVQYDGFVLNPESWTDEFLKYDYVGAPWPVGRWETGDFPKELHGTWVVGNGGFSLRSKKFIQITSRLCKEKKITKFHPEDIVVCVWYRDILKQEGITFAPVDLAHKFSVESKVEVYGKPFGFHGAYHENIDAITQNYPTFPVYNFMSRFRKKRIEKIHKVFKDYAAEGHLLGSNARKDTDDFSDVDIWFTFNDAAFLSVLEKRFDLYKEVGDVVHICEPHQNAPINGKFSSVIYKTRAGLLIVDYYLCPQSSAFTTNESTSLFETIKLPIAELGLNPQKVTVDDNYRIDFFICFIFNSIKKIVRKNPESLQALFREYDNLKERYAISVKELLKREHNFETLLQITENIKEVANEKQKNAIIEIENFARLVEKNVEK